MIGIFLSQSLDTDVFELHNMDLIEADHDNHDTIVWSSILDYVYVSQSKVWTSTFLLMLIRQTDDVFDTEPVPPL